MRRLLTFIDREEISRGVAEGIEFKEIVLRIGRDPSIVSREVGRHGGGPGIEPVRPTCGPCGAGSL